MGDKDREAVIAALVMGAVAIISAATDYVVRALRHRRRRRRAKK